MIGNIGMSELVLIFLVVLLVFGAKRIPEIARGLGQGLREFRHATRSVASELDLEIDPHAGTPHHTKPAPHEVVTLQASDRIPGLSREAEPSRPQHPVR